jgi:hypothetical protein
MEVKWKKSSRSEGASNCIELAYAGKVRDTKNPGMALPVSLAGLVAVVKAGRFDR